MLAYVRSHVEEDDDDEKKINMTAFREHFKKWCYKEGHDKLAKISSQSFWPALRRVLDSEGYIYRKIKDNKQFIKGIRVKGLNDGTSIRNNFGTIDDFFGDM